MGVQRNSQGITLSLGTLTFPADLVSEITQDEQSLPVLDGSHLGSTDWREFIPGELKTPGSMTFTVWFDPDDWQKLLDDIGTEETIGVQFPPVGTQATGALLSGQGWFNGGGWSASTDELMTGTVTVQWKGAVTVTPGSA